jgi:hypothetical protein
MYGSVKFIPTFYLNSKTDSLRLSCQFNGPAALDLAIEAAAR